MKEKAAIRFQLNRDKRIAKMSAYQKVYYAKNMEYILQRSSLYKKINKHIGVNSEARRRARKRDLPNTLTGKDVEAIFIEYKHACAICGSNENVQLDHWIPLKVNAIGTIYENSIPLCESHNKSKRDVNPNVWVCTLNKEYAENVEYIYNRLAVLNGVSVADYKETIDWLFGK